MNTTDKIKKRIDSRVDLFWSQVAMNWISRVISGNRHFISDANNIRIKVKNGYVARFTCDVLVTMPDIGSSVTKQITYTCKYGKHKVSLA
jgi:hypothetical protein